MSFFRELGNVASKILKPDGTSILSFPTVPGLPIGSARPKGNSPIEDVALLYPDDVLDYAPDPTKTPPLNVAFLKKPGGGPPYENVLEQFASYVPLWTMACLEPNQFNDPSLYRGNPSALNNIIFASAGRYDAQRVATAYGTPEYFVDNFMMDSQLGGTAKTGNTNVTNFSFDVYEPYSLGLFLQSLQAAALNSGYPSYLNDCPYLLQLDFLGYKDNGAVLNASKDLTKYFTIKITNVQFTVDQGGSKYKVEAAPFHHTGFSDVIQTLPVDVQITGEQVNEVLVSGEQSLCVALNTQQLKLVGKTQDIPDLYEIVFPIDHSDLIGLIPGANNETLKAMADPKKPVKQRIPPSQRNQLATNFGDGAIGAASMGFSATSGGNYLFNLEGDVIDQKTGRIKRDFMTIDPKQRAFVFPQHSRIIQIIERIVLSSEYVINATKPENIKDGFVDWFRIDVQIQLLDFDQKRNVRAKKFVYRVIPYKASVSKIKNPSATTPGEAKLQEIIAKRYDYLYTGQNNDIIRFDLKFDGMFYAGALPSPPEKNQNIVNNGTQTSGESAKTTAKIQGGSNPNSSTSPSGSPPVKPDYTINTQSASGDKTVEQIVADVFNKSFQVSQEMVGVELEILGDPYFLSDSGICSNHFSAPGPNDQINEDGSMNWEGSMIFVYITWRNPLEPNLGTTGKGGLFNFPDGGKVTPFSGIYLVSHVDHKFSNGTFTQVLKLQRQVNQSIDYVGQENINAKNTLLYDTSEKEKPKTTPIDDDYGYYG